MLIRAEIEQARDKGQAVSDYSEMTLTIYIAIFQGQSLKRLFKAYFSTDWNNFRFI